MFFIGIFGIHPEEKKVSEIPVIHHPDYPMGVNADLYRNNDVFEFFFIPLIRYNKNYFLVFPNSNKIYFLDKDLAEEALAGRVTVNYYDLTESSSFINSCPDCGREVEGNFKFCPYCGREMK